MKLSVVLFVLALLSPALQAEEGLYLLNDGAPSSVREAWDKVFTFTVARGMSSVDAGSAFLAGKAVRGDQTDLIFVTANHVLDDSCASGKWCSGLLSSNIALKSKIDPNSSGLQKLWQGFDLFIYGYYNQITQPKFTSFYVMSRSTNPDVAIVTIPLWNKDAVGIPEPLPISRTCSDLKEGDRLYSIGMPITSYRTAPNHKEIEEQETNTKRWSQGIFIGEKNSKGQEIMATTDDGFGGMSGGPILNQAGEVVSLAIGGEAGPPNQFAYQGDENPGHFHLNLAGPSCRIMQELRAQLVDHGYAK